MDIRGVRHLDDLVCLEDVETDAGDAAVRLVVDEQVAPIVGPVRERDVGMVEVAVVVDAKARFQKLSRRRAVPSPPREMPNSTRKMMYLSAVRR
jgi:hypothetical protein